VIDEHNVKQQGELILMQAIEEYKKLKVKSKIIGFILVTE
jgi:hypothetical protein